ISRSSQSTPLTLEQKSRRSAGSSRRNSAISLAWSAPSRRECWAAGPGFRTIATEEPGKRARMRSRICSGVSMAAGRLGSLLAGEDGRLPERGVLGRLEVVLAELGQRGAARNVDVDRDIAVDALEHIVALLEGSAGDGAGAHRYAVFRLRHLVPEAHDLRGHLLRDRARDDEKVRLARRRAKNLRAEAGDVEASHRGRHHLDRAACEPEIERPNRVAAGPIVEFLQARE